MNRIVAIATTLSLCIACGDQEPEETPPAGDDVVEAGEDTPTPEEDSAVVEPEPGLKDLGPQPTTETAWEWMSRHDGTAVGAHQYQKTPDAFVEYSRFEIWESFRVRAIRIQVQVAKSTTLQAHIFDDFSGNFLHPDYAKPLATVERAVTPEDSMTWLELAIDPPLEVAPGQLVYAGLIVDGADAPRMAVDAEPTSFGEDKPGGSVVWLTKEVDPESGANVVFSGASGDFMVELEVQQFGIVAPEDALFEEVPVEEDAMPAVSRGAAADFDNDGDLDLMAGAALYQNDGAGRLVNVSATWLPEGVGWGGGVWGDYDNDGDPDWLGTGGPEVLLRNEGDKFVDVTAASGIDDRVNMTCNENAGLIHRPTEAAAWLDYDGDGLLDLYLANYECWTEHIYTRDVLYKNNGDGTFTDVTSESGLAAMQSTPKAGRGLSPADDDNDGDMDLLVVNYRLTPNLHLRNNGDGTFTDVGAESKLRGQKFLGGGGVTYGHGIGAVWGDYDGNGWLDVFIGNLAHPRFIHFSDKASLYYSSGTPDPWYLNVTDDVGFRYQETASSPTSWDFDNDGDLDLLWTCVYEGRPTQFYRNDYPAGWTEITMASGLRVENGWGSVAGDWDMDGDLDWIARGGMKRNRNRFGNYAIQVRPRGGGTGMTNKSGFGARVTVTVDGRKRMQELGGAHGTGCQDSPWLHFGIGKAKEAHVSITFPVTGTTHDLGVMAAGRYTASEDGTVQQNP